MKVLTDSSVIADLEAKGFVAKSSTETAFKAQIAEQRTYWALLATQAGVKIQ